MYCDRHYHAVSDVSTCSFSYASVAVEFDPTTYTVTESEGAVVMFRIVKRTMTTQPVSVIFNTSPGTATGKEILHFLLRHHLFNIIQGAGSI